MRTLICLLAATAALACAPARAEVYKWIDKDGRIHYSDSLPGKGARVIAIQDRLSLYSPEPAVAQALRTPATTTAAAAALADRVAALERQLQSERLARQSAAPDPRAAYERCLAERRTDCDTLLGTAPAAGGANRPTALGRERQPLRSASAS
jgi:uncharacterized protein DUF4124